MPRQPQATAPAILVLAAGCCLGLANPTTAQGPVKHGVTGRVLVGDQRAPLRAEVHLFAVESAYAAARHALDGVEAEPTRSVSSDEAGLLSFTTPGPGPWRVEIEAPGYLPMSRTLPPLPQVVELPPVLLIPADLETIRIRDPEGKPALGTWVEVVESRLQAEAQDGTRGWQRRRVAGFCDAEGNFTFLRGVGERLEVRAINAWGEELLTLRPGGSGLVQQAFPDPEVSRFRVIDEAGRSVAGAVLSVDGRPVALSRADKAVTLWLSPQSTLTVTTSQGGGGTWSASDLAAGPVGARGRAHRLLAAPPSTVAGRVLDHDSGQPISGALLVSGPSLVTSDREGRFEIELVGQTPYRLGVTSSAYLPLELEALSQSASPLSLKLRPAAAVKGLVLWSTGEPAAGIELEVRRVTTGDDPGQRAWARSQGDGLFYFPALSPRASYELLARPRHHPEVALNFRAPDEFRTNSDLHVLLQRFRGVSGWVLSHRGEAVGGATIWLQQAPSYAGWDEPHRAQTETTGRFVVPQVKTGTARLHVAAPGFASQTVRVDIPDSGNTPLELAPVILEPAVELALRIVDEEEQPLGGARVDVKGSPGGGLVSDPDGLVLLSDLGSGDYVSIQVALSGFVTTEVDRIAIPEAPQEAPFEIALEAAGSITGTVLDPAGYRLPDIFVAVASSQAGRKIPADTSTRTDGRGEFRLEGLPSGLYEVWARSARYAEMEPVEVELGSGEELQGLVFQVPESTTLEGQVRDGQGLPVEDAVVVCADQMDRSDAAGHFFLDKVRLGRHPIEARASNRLELRREITIDRGRNYVELVLPTTTEVSGWLLDEQGLPVAGADLRLMGPNGPAAQWHDARTDATGSFYFSDLLPGSYTVTAHPREPRTPAGPVRPKRLEVGQAPLLDFEFVLQQGARVRGQILGHEGGNWEGIRVSARGSHRSVWGSVEHGAYRIDGLDPGPWEIVAFAEHTLGQARRLITIEGREEVVVDLEFESGPVVELQGHVRSEGRPMPGVWLLLVPSGSGTTRSGRTGLDGEYRFPPVETGLYRLSLLDPKTGLGFAQEVDLRGDSRLDLSLQRTVVAGVVLDSTSYAALADATVSLLDEGGRARRDRSTATDASGRFRLEALVAGPYRLRVLRPGFTSTELALSPGLGEVEVVLQRDAR